MKDSSGRSPQTIGQLLDGAIRLYVSSFRPFTIALGAIAITSYLSGFLAGFEPHRSLLLNFKDVLNDNVPPVSSKQLLDQLLAPGFLMASLCDLVGIVLMMTVGFACAEAVGSDRDAPSVRESLRIGFARLLPALGATLVELSIVTILALTALFLAVLGFAAFRRVAPVAVIVPLLVCLIGGFALYTLAQMAWYQSMFAVTVDGCGVFRGCAQGISRTIGARYIKRAVLIGLVIALTDVAELLVGDGLGDLVDCIPRAAIFGGFPTTLLAVPVQAIQIAFILLCGRDTQRRLAAAETRALVPA